MKDSILLLLVALALCISVDAGSGIGVCTTSDDCQSTPFSHCVSNNCICKAGFIDISDTCVANVVTTCQSNSIKVSVPKATFASSGIDPTSAHIGGNYACVGHAEDNTIIFSLRGMLRESCNTKVVANKTHIIYSNFISANETTDGIIITGPRSTLPFQCVFSTNQNSTIGVNASVPSIVLPPKPSSTGDFQYLLQTC
uniref:ZP domain-containing protein n=1 Tax=Ciona savignyi TaxID=51511 RepID=H2ZNI2_CIOSA